MADNFGVVEMAYADGENAISAVGYTHDAIIDILIARPMVTQREVARHFGYTESWICQVMSSDSFKKRFADRRDAVVEPMIAKSLENLFEGVGRLSLTVVAERLEASRDADLAIKAMEITRKAAGLGDRGQKGVTVQNFVAMVPQKSADFDQWSATYDPAAGGRANGSAVPLHSEVVVAEDPEG